MVPIFFEGRLQIGCIHMSIQDWLKDYEKIGKNYAYTVKETEMYGNFIKMCHTKWLKEKEIKNNNDNN